MPQTITKQQALQRWDALPESLREALASEINSDFIWKTGGGEHLPEEKIFALSRIAGYVILGFLHPGDVAQELKEVLAINQQLADSIASKMNERVFNPIKADLDKIYEPPLAVSRIELSALAPVVSASTPFSTSRIEPPRPVVEIKPPTPSQAGAALSPTASIIGGLKPPVVSPSTPLGTSGIEPFEIKLTETPSPSKPMGDIKLPTPTSFQPTTTPLPFKIGVPLAPSRIEGSAPPFTKPETKPPMMSASAPLSTSHAEPPPTMLHEEPLSPSSKFTQGFKIDIPQPKLSEVRLRSDAPMRPAVLELGETKPSTPGKMGLPAGNEFDKFITNRVEQRKPGEENARVVHYSEFKTPFDAAQSKPLDSASLEATRDKLGKPFDAALGKPPVVSSSTPLTVNRVEPEREIKEITAAEAAPKPGIPAWAKPPEANKIELPVPTPGVPKPQMSPAPIAPPPTPPKVPAPPAPPAT